MGWCRRGRASGDGGLVPAAGGVAARLTSAGRARRLGGAAGGSASGAGAGVPPPAETLRLHGLD